MKKLLSIFIVPLFCFGAEVQKDDVIESLVTVGSGLNTIITLTVADDEVMDIDVKCTAHADDGSEGGSFRHVATYRKDGAAANVQVGFTDVVANQDCGTGTNTCEVKSFVSGTADIIVQVDGSSGSNINWDCMVTISRRAA